jgi:hypothetical protein
MSRDFGWLWDRRHGMTAEFIAERDGVTVRQVQDGIARARDGLPDVLSPPATHSAVRRSGLRLS